LDSDRQMDWQVYCYTDDEWFEELVYDLVVSHTDDEYEDEWGDVRAPCLYDGSGNEKSRVLNPDGGGKLSLPESVRLKKWQWVSTLTSSHQDSGTSRM